MGIPSYSGRRWVATVLPMEGVRPQRTTRRGVGRDGMLVSWLYGA